MFLHGLDDKPASWQVLLMMMMTIMMMRRRREEDAVAAAAAAAAAEDAFRSQWNCCAAKLAATCRPCAQLPPLLPSPRTKAKS